MIFLRFFNVFQIYAEIATRGTRRPRRSVPGRRREPRGGSKTPPRAPRGPPGPPRRPQDGPKTAQDGPKTTPRPPQDGPRRPQDGPKRPQDAPRAAPGASWTPLGYPRPPGPPRDTPRDPPGPSKMQMLGRFGGQIGSGLESIRDPPGTPENVNVGTIWGSNCVRFGVYSGFGFYQNSPAPAACDILH